MIVTDVEAVTSEHPPAAVIVYVTVYIPGVLKLGSIDPVTEFILSNQPEKMYKFHLMILVNITD